MTMWLENQATTGEIVAAVTGLAGAIGTLAGAVFAVRTAQLKSLEKAVAGAREQLDTEHKESDHLRTVISELDAQLDGYRARIRKIETDFTERCAVCGRAVDKTSEETATRLGEISRMIEGVEPLLEQNKTQITFLQHELTEMTERLEQADAHRTNLQDENDWLKRQLDGRQERLTSGRDEE